MEEKDFEFYEFMEQLKKEKNMREIDRQVIETANKEKNRRHFDEQEEVSRRQKKSKKSYRIKSGALTFLMVFSFATGIGVKTLYDKVSPIVVTYVQNEADDISLAGWFENFSMSKTGYLLDTEIKRENSDSWFSDGPMPYDYDDPDNLRVTSDGRKVGAIVDYYNAFDDYLEESAGVGYYETKFEQMQRLVSIGKDPNSIDCIYTYEELCEMFSKDNDKGMGVK